MHKPIPVPTIGKAIFAALALAILSACGGGSSDPVPTEAAPKIKQIEMYKLYGEDDPIEGLDSTIQIDTWNEAIHKISKIELKITQEQCLTFISNAKNTKWIWSGSGFVHVLTLGEDEAAQLQQLGYAPFINSTSERADLTNRVCLPGAVLSSTKTK